MQFNASEYPIIQTSMFEGSAAEAAAYKPGSARDRKAPDTLLLTFEPGSSKNSEACATLILYCGRIIYFCTVYNLIVGAGISISVLGLCTLAVAMLR